MANPVVIDQQNLGPRDGGFGVFDGALIGQTFTVGITGRLTQFELAIFNPNDPAQGDPFFPDPLTVELRNTALGSPGATVLRSWTLPVGDVTLDRNALTPFTDVNLGVTAGQALAIILRTTGNFGWSTNCCYAGGDFFISSHGSAFRPLFPTTTEIPNDFIFRTSVEPLDASQTPEPATLLLLGTALVGMRFRRGK